MRLRPGNGAVVLTAGLAAAVLLGPFALRGDPIENARLEANRRQIEDMTEAERQRLERNFARWRSLSPAERQQWRDFSARLNLNRASLGPVLEEYNEWLQTVPGYRREQLREAAPGQKVELVDEILEEQLAARLDAPPRGGPLGGDFRISPLNSAELDAVMTALEGVLLDQERGRLVDREGSPLKGVERHLMVLAMIRNRFGAPPELAQQQRVMRTLYDALPEQVRISLQQNSDERPHQIALRAIVILGLSLRNEFRRLQEELRPTPDKLRAYYEQSLTDAEREQLLNLSAREFNEQLSARYYREQLEKRLDIDLGQLQRFLSWWDVAPPRRDGPPGDRGPGERGFGDPSGRRPVGIDRNRLFRSDGAPGREGGPPPGSRDRPPAPGEDRPRDGVRDRDGPRGDDVSDRENAPRPDREQPPANPF